LCCCCRCRCLLQDLSGKVFSAVMLQGANMANSSVVGSQVSGRHRICLQCLRKHSVTLHSMHVKSSQAARHTGCIPLVESAVSCLFVCCCCAAATAQFARADAKGAILSNVDFTDANCFGT
jgi:uncharacterized protein YjbI with pentapeptide repeats